MRRYNYSDLTKTDIQNLVQRNVDPANEIRAIVEDIIEHVKEHGDSALGRLIGRLECPHLHILNGSDQSDGEKVKRERNDPERSVVNVGCRAKRGENKREQIGQISRTKG